MQYKDGSIVSIWVSGPYVPAGKSQGLGLACPLVTIKGLYIFNRFFGGHLKSAISSSNLFNMSQLPFVFATLTLKLDICFLYQVLLFPIS